MNKLPREPDYVYPELGYAIIGLTRGYSTKVSLEDYNELKMFDWAVHIGSQLRAVRFDGRKTYYLHHEVLRLMNLSLTAGLETDHINQDTLDNRRENLRLVSHHENMRNTARHKERKGYMLHKPSGRWFAYVNYPGNKVASLGYYPTEEKACEMAELGRAVQNRCVTIEEFKLEWKKLGLWKPHPGKRRA